MAAPRGPTRHLRGAYILYLYIYIYIYIYIWVFSLAYMGRVNRPFNPSGLINLTDSINFFPCGTKSHIVFSIAGHVERGEALDHDWSAPIKWTRGPRIKIKTTCLLKQVITALISCDVAASHTSDQRRRTLCVDRVNAEPPIS